MIEANEIEARELVTFGTNCGDLYRSAATPTIANLARKMRRGVYDPALAPKAFRYWADRAAVLYQIEFGPCVGAFNAATRRLAAQMALDYYLEQIEEESQ